MDWHSDQPHGQRRRIPDSARRQIQEMLKDVGSSRNAIHIAIFARLYTELDRLGIEAVAAQHSESMLRLREEATAALRERGDPAVAKRADPFINQVVAIYRSHASRRGLVQAPSWAVSEAPSSASEDRLARIKQAREHYRYLGVSIESGGVAISLNDGYNRGVGIPALFRWEDDERFWGDRVVDPACVEHVLGVIVAMIDALLGEGVQRSQIRLVTVAVAGPVDKKQGIVGSPFKCPRLPFFMYPLAQVLGDRLKSIGLAARIEVENDAEASRKGERNSPKGQLRGKTGGVVFIGKEGVNISVDDETIQEAGHNLIETADRDGVIHYRWVGHLSKGYHPIERGNDPLEIEKKSGERGREYVQWGEEEFVRRYPDFPIIDWAGGQEDFDGRLSATAIRERFQAVSRQIQDAAGPESPEAGYYRAIDEAAGAVGEAYEHALTLQARGPEPNPVAIQWIEGLGNEVGLALAAFIHFYRTSYFVRNIVLVSDVNEHLGKGVYRPAAAPEEVEQGPDLYLSNIRSGALSELVNHFGLDTEDAETIVRGIVRSELGHERTLMFHRCSDEEVLESEAARIAAKPAPEEALAGIVGGAPAPPPLAKAPAVPKRHAVPKYQLTLGKAPDAVTCGQGVVIGAGAVLPEVNCTLPAQEIHPGTLDALRDQYRAAVEDLLRRAVALRQDALVVAWDLASEFAQHPEWAAAVTRSIKNTLRTFHETHGLRTALRVTVADTRGEERPPRWRAGKNLESMLATFEQCAASGADILSLASVAGQEGWEEALARRDLRRMVLALGVFAPRDTAFVWERIAAIARDHRIVAGGDSASWFSHAATPSAAPDRIPRVLVALVRLMSVPRSLAAVEMGATGPLLPGGENPVIKALTGVPISMQGKTAAGALSRVLGNIAAAACDLWSDGCGGWVREFAGPAPGATAEMLIYDCRLMNRAIRDGHMQQLQKWMIEADHYMDPEALMLDPGVANEAARRIAQIGSDPYERTVEMTRYALEAIRTAVTERHLTLPAEECYWLDTLERAVEDLPETPDRLISEVTSTPGAVWAPSEYGLVEG